MDRDSKKIYIKILRRELSLLNKQRTGYIFSVIHGKPMIHGLPHEVFRKCGKKNCRCSIGQLHGPYHALAVNKDGKQKIVMVKKADVPVILKKSKRYRYYQKTLKKIRRIDKEIDTLLEKLKLATTKSYP